MFKNKITISFQLIICIIIFHSQSVYSTEPSISAIINQSIFEDAEPITINYTVSHQDGDMLTITVENQNKAIVSISSLLSYTIITGVGLKDAISILKLLTKSDEDINNYDIEYLFLRFQQIDLSDLIYVLQTLSDSSTKNSVETSIRLTPKANQYGNANIIINAVDSKGITAKSEFKINITPINDPPNFSPGQNQSLNEDSGIHKINGWATNISPGPNESSQQLDFIIDVDKPELFLNKQVEISNDGTLEFTPAKDAYGTCNVYVKLIDTGGIMNGGIDTSNTESFTIEIKPVNDPPSFTIIGEKEFNIKDNSSLLFDNWISEISPGALNESQDSLSFNITCSNEKIFNILPEISLDGTLSFKSAQDIEGSSIVRVSLDDGQAVNSQSEEQTFYINVMKQQGLKTPGKDDSGCFITTTFSNSSTSYYYLLLFVLISGIYLFICNIISLRNINIKNISIIFFFIIFFSTPSINAQQDESITFGYMPGFVFDFSDNEDIEEEFKKDMDVSFDGIMEHQIFTNIFNYPFPKKIRKFLPYRYRFTFDRTYECKKTSGNISNNVKSNFLGIDYELPLKTPSKNLKYIAGLDFINYNKHIPYNNEEPVTKDYKGFKFFFGLSYAIHIFQNLYCIIEPKIAFGYEKFSNIDFVPEIRQFQTMIGFEYRHNITLEHLEILPSIIMFDITENDPYEVNLKKTKNGIISFLKHIEIKEPDKQNFIRVVRSYGSSFDYLDTIKNIDETVSIPKAGIHIANQILSALNTLKEMNNKSKKKLIYIISSEQALLTQSSWKKYNIEEIMKDNNIEFNCILIGSYGGSRLKKLTDISGGKLIKCETGCSIKQTIIKMFTVDYHKI